MRGEVFVNPSRPVLFRSWPVHTPSQTKSGVCYLRPAGSFPGQARAHPHPSQSPRSTVQDEPGMGAGARRKGSHEVAHNIFVSRIVYRRAFISSVIVKIYESHAGSKKAFLFQTKPS